MAFTTTPTSLEFFKQGKLIPLAVSGAQRIAVLPDVPAVGETVAGFDAVEWQGIVVPAGTPRDVINTLHREIVSTLADPAVKERILAQGSVIVGNTPQEFEAHIKAELTKWLKVAKETGIKADL